MTARMANLNSNKSRSFSIGGKSVPNYNSAPWTALFLQIWLLLLTYGQLVRPHQIVLDLSDVRLAKCLNTPCDSNNLTNITAVVNSKSKPGSIKVCGSDGRTYGSHCELKKASCLGHNITVRSIGECTTISIQTKQLSPHSSPATRCNLERSHAQKLAKTPKVGVFVPRCHENGTFVQVQCYAAYDYCWCVDAIGRPIPGTSTHSKRPNCDGSPVFPSTSDGVQKRSVNGLWTSRHKVRRMCTADNRKNFNANLLVVFAVEYLRSQLNQTTLEEILLPSSDNNTTNNQFDIQAAKFAQLDTDRTGNLSRAELRAFRQLIKRVVMPRRCSRSFIGYCDLDQDRFVTLAEWQFCLHVADPRAIRGALQRYYTSNNYGSTIESRDDAGLLKSLGRQPNSILPFEPSTASIAQQQKPVSISPAQRRLIDVSHRRAQQQLQALRAAAAATAGGGASSPWASTHALSLLQPAAVNKQQSTSSSSGAGRRISNDDDYDDIGHQGGSAIQTPVVLRNGPVTAQTYSQSNNNRGASPSVAKNSNNMMFATVERPSSATRHRQPILTATVHEADENNDGGDDDDENIWEAHLKYGRRRTAAAATGLANALQQRLQQQQQTALLSGSEDSDFSVQPRTTGNKSTSQSFESKIVTTDSSSQHQKQPQDGWNANPHSNANSLVEPRSCAVERQKAQLRQRTHSVAARTVHVPECDARTGKFRPAQCHPQADFCWCVDIHTGVPVPGSSVPASTAGDDTSGWGQGQPVINCTNVRPVRHYEGCPPELHAEFASELLQLTRLQHNDAQKATNFAMDQQNECEMRWKFSQADVDNNHKLERREWLPLRVELRRQGRLRKCSRNFLRFCDANDDRIIDMDEWLECCLVSRPASATSRIN